MDKLKFLRHYQVMTYESTGVTLRQLRAFVQVAERESFVAASRELHVTASALSILIAELEQALGFRVLDRTTRRVRLSAAGSQYFPWAERVLMDLQGAHRCAEELRSQKTGVVRVATSQVIAWTLMPPVYAAFRAFRPDVRLEPLDLAVDEILPSLASGRADLAITLAGPPGEELRALPVFASRVHLACRLDHRWAGRKRLGWSELAEEPLIFTGTDTPQRINAALPPQLRLEGARQVEHTGTALALVASGFGSAICAGYVRPMCGMHRLRMVPLAEPEVVREFALYAPRRRAASPPVEGFAGFLAQWFGKLGQGFVERTLP
jgi:DNA-binding transcriptional LysR family regulator